MHFRSINDMNTAIIKNMHRLPRDLNLVVGVPRSGMLAANLLALTGNINMTDLDSYLDGRIYSSGRTKTHCLRSANTERRKVLILDDSIRTGESMTKARQRLAAASFKDTFMYAAVYGAMAEHPETDLVFEFVNQPRIFQWNFMHHVALKRACVDIDGVLCHDPSEHENDDGAAYIEFLNNAHPLYRMTRPIGALVTSRLEKYRAQTEAWLASAGIEYRELIMLDLPSKAERQRLAAHGSFKGEYYRNSPFDLFIESENRQAWTIARLSGKPVLCLETHTLIEPTAAALLSSLPRAGSFGEGLNMIKRSVRMLAGSERYEALTRLIRPNR